MPGQMVTTLSNRARVLQMKLARRCSPQVLVRIDWIHRISAKLGKNYVAAIDRGVVLITSSRKQVADNHRRLAQAPGQAAVRTWARSNRRPGA
jgi:hypothetical protein